MEVERQFTLEKAGLRLQPFAEARLLWSRLIKELPGATLYHGEEWLTLLATAYRLPIWIATLIERGAVVSATVFSRTPLSRRFVSLPFSDACPPLGRTSEAVHRLLTLLADTPLSKHGYEVRGIDGPEPWETARCFVTWRIDLDRPVAQIEAAFAANFRRNLKRAQRAKLAIVRGNDVGLLKRFYALQLESRRRLGLPAQPWRFFLTARDIFAAKEDFEIWVAEAGKKDLASAIFIRNCEVVHYKWAARSAVDSSHANHFLSWNAIRHFATCAKELDLGRSDIRNAGLMRFKRELGGVPTPLPYAFYPCAPKRISPERMTGATRTMSLVWAQLPIAVTRVLGGAIYRYLG